MAEEQGVQAARRRGRVSIDAAMAVFASIALGFAVFAMPDDLFQNLLGGGVRMRVVIGAAAAAFAIVFGLLRALERLPSAAQRRSAELPSEPPRLRRADAHPDAPSRRPIFARHELGTPLPAEQPTMETEFAAPVEVAQQGEAVELELDAPLPDQPEAIAEPEVEEVEILELEQPLPVGQPAIGESEPADHAATAEAEVEQLLPGFVPQVEAPEMPASGEEAATEPEFLATFEEGAVDSAELPLEIEAVNVDPPLEEIAPVDLADAELVPQPISIPFQPEPASTGEPPVDRGHERDIAAADSDGEPQADVEAEAEFEQPAVFEPHFMPVPTPASAESELAIAEPKRQPAGSEDQPSDIAQDAEQATEQEGTAPAESQEAPGREVRNDQASAVKAAPEPVPADEPIETLAGRIPDASQAEDASISDLMGRLEKGLGRSDRARWLGHAKGDAPEEETPVDDRLRNAIGMLRRMAGRKG